MSRVLARIPIGEWLPRYRRDWVAGDLVAGTLLAALLVPQGIAYAGIAGVAPQAGLYAAAAGLALYAILGSSRHLAVSPTSSSAAILAAAVLPLAGGGPEHYAALASALAITVGLVFLLAAVLGLGAVSDFVSKPVLKGFMCGLGLTIIIKQAAKLLGVPGGHGDFFEQLWHLARVSGQASPATMALAGVALLVLFMPGLRATRVPVSLLVVAVGILAGTGLDLGRRGIALVGVVEGGLPEPTLPGVGWRQAIALAQAAAGIVLVAFSEALGAGRTLATAHDYEIDPDQELIALGVANVGAGLLQGIPVGAGASGSAVNERAGARTQVSTLTASFLVVLTLLFLTPLFGGLPEAVLAAIIVHAVSGLVDVGELRRYFRIRRGHIPATTALGGVLAFGVLPGMLLAVIVNIVLLLRRLGTPRCAELGRLPGTRTYVDLAEHTDAERIPGVVIVRLEGLLLFASVNSVLGRIRSLLRTAEPPARALIFNCETMFDIDLNGLDMLAQLESECRAAGIELTLARVGDRIRALLSRTGLAQRLGPARIFYSQKDAVDDYETRHPRPL
jgi:high affinity sulfate transporter 1